MPRLNNVSYKMFEKFLLYIGCKFERIKGDNFIYSRSDLSRPIVFPKEKTLPQFIIQNNLRALNLSKKEFEEILNRI